MAAVAVRLQAEDHLHLWIRPISGSGTGKLRVTIGGDVSALSVEGPSRNPLPIDWQCPVTGDASLDWDEDSTELSLAYGFSPASVAQDGIRVVWTSPDTSIDGARNRFHFAPPFGWMNDPNGLCELDGVTHLFYQHNPHGRRWNTMHWGHATSHDGVNWVHQPIALLPREALVRAEDQRGGAYSGTALPQPDDTIRLYYTDREDGRLPTREWQMTAVLDPGAVTPGPATLLLDTHPDLPGYHNEWRDPFVFEADDGTLRMLLGGADAQGSVVLLYETADPEGAEGWCFVDVLFREASGQAIPVECPCMIRLDTENLWVLIFGLIGSRDEATLRRNLTRTHVGRFDGRSFVSIATHELDFGTDCYAMQVWHAADGPRGIAWAANWVDVCADVDFESAMTLPRRLLWRDGRLFTPPIAAVDGLRAGPPIEVAAGGRVSIDHGLAEIALEIRPGTPLSVQLEHPTHGLAVEYDGRTLRLRYSPPGDAVIPDYRAECRDLRSLRLFIDVGLIELYADDGRLCCTKRIDSPLAIGAVRISPDSCIEAAKIWPIRAIGTPMNSADLNGHAILGQPDDALKRITG